jgi:hypothetical protein
MYQGRIERSVLVCIPVIVCREHKDLNSSAKRGAKKPNLQTQLQKWGLAGLAAYGVLNTLYYSVAVSTAWMILQVPPGVGITQALCHLSEALVSAWVLSQVTKVPRAFGCAISSCTVRSSAWLFSLLSVVILKCNMPEHGAILHAGELLV